MKECVTETQYQAGLQLALVKLLYQLVPCHVLSVHGIMLHHVLVLLFV